jgi:hypothetical protein
VKKPALDELVLKGLPIPKDRVSHSYSQRLVHVEVWCHLARLIIIEKTVIEGYLRIGSRYLEADA